MRLFTDFLFGFKFKISEFLDQILNFAKSKVAFFRILFFAGAIADSVFEMEQNVFTT